MRRFSLIALLLVGATSISATPHAQAQSDATPLLQQSAATRPARRQPMPQPTLDGTPVAPAAIDAASPAAPVARHALIAARAVTQPDAPMVVRVIAPEAHGALALRVIDRSGKVLETVSVTAGSINLRPLAPSIADAQHTLWLQLMEEDQAVGTPLWITPLRAPPAARTVRSMRLNTQQPYTRVVGWGDRAFDPHDPETAQAMPSWVASDPVVTGGFRLESACEAVLHTSEGDLRIAFAPDAAPATVDNFLRLARVGFYDGTIFHRIVPLDREGRPFVVQGGDPTGTGDGGPGWNLALEPSDMPHARGVLGMARGDDPHSAGSQFYIGLSRDGTARLDGQYCTFAFMMDGMDTLDRLAQSPIGDSATGRPSKPPTLDRVEIVPARACETGRPPHGGEPTPPTPVTPAEPATAVTP